MSLPKFAPLFLSFFISIFSWPALASGFDFSAGTLSINSSGKDGGDGWAGRDGSDGFSSGHNGSDGSSGDNGRNGEDAGDIELHLAYADSAKTLIRVSGRIWGRSFEESFDRVLSLEEIRQIHLAANGGDGGNGGHGGRGGDGARGRDGRSGCHATDGEDGGDGGDGGSAGNGGDAGRGGQIRVHVLENQTELLLLLKSTAHAGDPGSSGWPGSGGSAGRGGDGGKGGSDGSCNVNGEPTPAPDGRDGRSGSSGHSGSYGYSGRGESAGLSRIDVQTSNGVVTYDSPFRVQLSDLEIQDDNHDGIVEPGEVVHITGLTVANRSSMPTPVGQSMLLSLVDSNIFQVIKKPNLELTGGIPGGGTRTWSFEEGEFILKAAAEVSNIGSNFPLAFAIRINQLQVYSGLDVGITVRRPVLIGAGWKESDLAPYFGETTTLPLTLKNEGQLIIGGTVTREARLVISWSSENIQGKDVQITLPDSTQKSLQEVLIYPLPEIAAGQTLPLKFDLRVDKSIAGVYGQGRLSFRLEMASFDGPSMLKIAELAPSIEVAENLQSLAVDKKIDLRKMKISCSFNGSGDRAWKMKTLQLKKAAGATAGSMVVATDSFLGGSRSPAFQFPVHSLARYSEGILNTFLPDANVMLEFFNRVGVMATHQGGKWKIDRCAISAR